MEAFTDQISSVRAEAKKITSVVAPRLIAGLRILQLESAAFGLEGEIIDTGASRHGAPGDREIK